MRRVKLRIETLKETAGRVARTKTIGGWTATEDGETNRVTLTREDDRRATKEEKTEIKGHGFRWAPSADAWQRKLTNSAWNAALYIMGRMDEEPATTPEPPPTTPAAPAPPVLVRTTLTPDEDAAAAVRIIEATAAPEGVDPDRHHGEPLKVGALRVDPAVEFVGEVATDTHGRDVGHRTGEVVSIAPWLSKAEGAKVRRALDPERPATDAERTAAIARETADVLDQLGEGSRDGLRSASGGTLRGQIVKEQLRKLKLINADDHTLTMLGARVLAALPPKKYVAPSVLTPEPEGALRSLTGLGDGLADRAKIAAALRKLIRARVPALKVSITTPQYSMASGIDIMRPDHERWTVPERAALGRLFGKTVSVDGNRAMLSPWDRVSQGGTALEPDYVADFKTLWAGGKLAAVRKKAKARKAAAGRSPGEVSVAGYDRSLDYLVEDAKTSPEGPRASKEIAAFVKLLNHRNYNARLYGIPERDPPSAGRFAGTPKKSTTPPGWVRPKDLAKRTSKALEVPGFGFVGTPSTGPTAGRVIGEGGRELGTWTYGGGFTPSPTLGTDAAEQIAAAVRQRFAPGTKPTIPERATQSIADSDRELDFMVANPERMDLSSPARSAAVLASFNKRLASRNAEAKRYGLPARAAAPAGTFDSPAPAEPEEELGEARLEFVDVTTGERRPAGAAGTAASGRLVATVEGATVEVDRESLASSGSPEDPRARTYQFDKLDPMMDYPAAAKREKAKRPPKGKTPTKPRIKGLRDTFPSAAKAAKIFYDNNAGFYDPVDDPADGIHEWGDGVDVGTGSRTKKLNRSAAGRKIASQPRGAPQVRAALQWVFSQAKGRRWDAVDWAEIDRLDAALLPNRFADQGGPEASTWRPTIGRLDAETLDAVKPEDRERIRDYESHVEIKEALAELKDAYRRNSKCIPPLLRQTALHRIKEWSTWARNPKRIPAYACEPDMATGGHLCNYPAVAGELRQLTNACDRAYDPDWAADDAKQGLPGFPDTSAGEADTAPRPAPALLWRPQPEPASAWSESVDQLASLRDYAAWAGDDWRSSLSRDWMRSGSEWPGEWAFLQQLRNEPAFDLSTFELAPAKAKPPKKKAAPKAAKPKKATPKPTPAAQEDRATKTTRQKTAPKKKAAKRAPEKAPKAKAAAKKISKKAPPKKATKKAAPKKAAAPKAKAAPKKKGRTVKQCASMLGKRGAAARKRNREKKKATETQRKRSLNDALAVAIS